MYQRIDDLEPRWSEVNEDLNATLERLTAFATALHEGGVDGVVTPADD